MTKDKPPRKSPGWTRAKPTAPGDYWALSDGARTAYIVRVVRRGRGLRVIPGWPFPPVPMNDIGAYELRWHPVESGK